MRLGILCLIVLGCVNVFASDVTGSFKCDDSGQLEVKKDGRVDNTYFSSLNYADGSSSILAYFELNIDGKTGTLFTDDEDPEIGKLLVQSNGKKLVLKFDSGDSVVCEKP